MISGEWSPGAKPLALTVDGAAVTENVVSAVLTDDMNGASDPKLGSACGAVLTLTVRGSARDWTGRTVTAAVAGVPLGVFTVTAAATKDDMTTVEAMDAMATAFEDEYVPAAASSTALGVIREIAAAGGVALGDVSGVTDVSVTGLTAGRTRRETLGLMAALLGRNAHMDRTGKLCLRWYAPGGVTVTADDYYPGALTMGDADYALDRIECTVRKTTSATSGGTTTETTETVVYAAGEGTTGISLTDDYMTQAILDGVYARIGGLTYRPMTVEFYGDARIETGDLLTVTDAAGTAHTVPVMKLSHAWDGGVRTTVTAFGDPAEGLSRSPAGALSRSVSNLMAEFARFQNLEAENVRAVTARLGTVEAEVAEIDEARIREAVIDELEAGGISADWIKAGTLLSTYIALCGFMSVYEDATRRKIGGAIGFATGSNSLGNGIAIQHKGPGGAGGGAFWDYNGGAIAVGDKAVYIGCGKGINWDGAGVNVNQANFSQYILMNDADLENDRPTIEIGTGALSPSMVSAQPNVVLGVNSFRPENTFNGYSTFEHITAPEISAKVSKSGDTMTGALTVTNAQAINSKNTNITVGSAPSSIIYGTGLCFRDKDNELMGYIRQVQWKDGGHATQIETRRVINGTTYYNTLGLTIGNDGVRAIQLSHPDAWRSALGVSVVTSKVVSVGNLTIGGNGYVQIPAGKLSPTPLMVQVAAYTSMSVKGALGVAYNNVNDCYLTGPAGCAVTGLSIRILYNA